MAHLHSNNEIVIFQSAKCRKAETRRITLPRFFNSNGITDNLRAHAVDKDWPRKSTNN